MKDPERTIAKSRLAPRVRRLVIAAALAGLAGLAALPDRAPAATAPSTLLAGHVSASPAMVTQALRRRPLRLLDGTNVSIASTSGQVVVLNFWATWCRSCVHELRTLERLNAEIAPRGGRVIAISIDQERSSAARFVKAVRMTLPVAHDGPSGLARELDLKQVPLTLVLDRTGAIAWCSSRTDEVGLAETRAETLKLLAAPAPPALAGEGSGASR